MKAHIFSLAFAAVIAMSCGGEDDPKPVDPKQQQEEQTVKKLAGTWVPKRYWYTNNLEDWGDVNCSHYNYSMYHPWGILTRTIALTENHGVTATITCHPEENPKYYTWSLEDDILYLPDGVPWDLISLTDELLTIEFQYDEENDIPYIRVELEKQ